MIKCVTCEQPLPEGTEEHPDYFAQYKRNPWENGVENFAEEVKTLLGDIEAIFGALAGAAAEIDEDYALSLKFLGGRLAGEAFRRLENLQEAWEQERACRGNGKEE